MRWQRRARVAVATFGIAAAVAMYAAMGHRTEPVAVAPLARTDPKAMIESAGNVLQQVRGTKQDYLIEAERQLTYKGGATTLVGVRITLRNRGGHDYIVTGREARTNENQRDLGLSGGVTLAANDGFVVRADVATFNQDSGLLTAPGAVTFERGRMTGSGDGMSYDKNGDVLTLLDRSHVVLTNGEGHATTEFTAGRTTFARPEHRLTLEGTMHALHDGRMIEAAVGVVHLTEDEQHVTDVDLTGGSRVSGGTGIESMAARDIILHYGTEDDALESAELHREGMVALLARDGSSGLHLAGDLLEVALGPDGSLTRTSGTGNVRLDVPASSSSAKAIRAQSLEGSGAPGQGLTNATLAGGVEYREDGDGRIASRLVRSRTLSLALAGETVGEARFVGGVTFEEQDFRAASAEARYDPSRGALRLTGVEAGKVPQVSDARATIDAGSIDVVLQGRVMKAAGAVKTVLRASPPAAGRNGARLPSLLRQQEAANVSADALDYRGEEGTATYTGNTTLWQGETAIRAEVIVMDQSRGDLQATGNARSSIVFDTGVSIGRASAITYADAMHTLVYSSSKSAVGSAVVQAQVSGPQGDLHGDRIEVRLAEQGGRIEGLEAVTNVSLRRDARLARGSRLTYYAADERYVMSGADARPVSVVEACKETTGKTLTFFGASDRIIVDGNEEIRTQTRNGPGAACAAAPRPR